MAALLLYVSVFSFLIQPALSLTDFAGEDTSSVLLVLCLMILEQHIAVPCLTQNLNLARHMGKDIAEAFSLAALHLFCTFHYGKLHGEVPGTGCVRLLPACTGIRSRE